MYIMDVAAPIPFYLTCYREFYVNFRMPCYHTLDFIRDNMRVRGYTNRPTKGRNAYRSRRT